MQRVGGAGEFSSCAGANARSGSRQRLYLHIGLHKTGTTSFQDYCASHREELDRQDLVVFQPLASRASAHEIALAVLRPGVVSEPAWYRGKEQVRGYLQNFLATCVEKDVLISAESLSYIRTQDECLELKKLFGHWHDAFEIIVLAVVRDRHDWWQSYCNEIRKTPIGPQKDPRSCYCLDEAGWLTDFSTLFDVLEKNFDEVKVLAYNKQDMTPGLLEAMGRGPIAGYQTRRLNARDKWPRLRRWYKRNLSDTVVGRVIRACKAVFGLRGQHSQ